MTEEAASTGHPTSTMDISTESIAPFQGPSPIKKLTKNHGEKHSQTAITDTYEDSMLSLEDSMENNLTLNNNTTFDTENIFPDSSTAPQNSIDKNEGTNQDESFFTPQQDQEHTYNVNSSSEQGGHHSNNISGLYTQPHTKSNPAGHFSKDRSDEAEMCPWRISLNNSLPKNLQSYGTLLLANPQKPQTSQRETQTPFVPTIKSFWTKVQKTQVFFASQSRRKRKSNMLSLSRYFSPPPTSRR